MRRDLTALVGPEVAAEGNFLIETHLDPVLQAVLERQLRSLLNNAKGLSISEGGRCGDRQPQRRCAGHRGRP